MTQLKQLEKHMLNVGSITNIEASALYRVRSLTKQMTNLRRQGMNIMSEWKRDITGQRYVRYHYIGRV